MAIWLSLSFLGTLCLGEPYPRPATFFGTVDIDGVAVGESIEIRAEIDGVEVSRSSTRWEGGRAVYRLDVPADVLATSQRDGGREGETIQFRVGSGLSPETVIWSDGIHQQRNLSGVAGSDLAVSIDDGASRVSPGDRLTYEISIQNSGPYDLTGIEVHDPVPIGTSFVSAEGGGAVASGMVTWPPFDLESGGSRRIRVTFDVASSFAAGQTEILNAVSVEDDGGSGIDPNPTNNRAEDRNLLDGGPDVEVRKIASVAQAAPGADVGYTIEVRNHGYQRALQVALVDMLPVEVNFLSASNDGIQSAQGHVSWPDFDVDVGELVTRTVRVRVAEPLAGDVRVLENRALVSGVAHDLDPANDSDVHSLPVARQADLAALAVEVDRVTLNPQTLAVTGVVGVSVSNVGNEDLDLPFQIAVFEDRDHDGELGASDLVLGSLQVGELLRVGRSTLLDVAVAGQIRFRHGRLLAKVDAMNQVLEFDETNNVAAPASSCEVVPVVGEFDPRVELRWPGSLDPVDQGSFDSLSTPLLAQLTDDNGDGSYDERDVPDLIFVTYDLSNPFNPLPRLRAIRGDSGEPIFDAYPPVSGLFQLFALSGAAVADLDGDGKPEILVSTFDYRTNQGRPNRFAAYSHRGQLLWVSHQYSTHPDGDTLSNRDNPSIADLDGDGTPEIVVGANVFDNRGRLRWRGSGGHGYQSPANVDDHRGGAISIVADLDLDGLQEVLTGNTAYRHDGSIFWQIPLDDGYPAVGNFDSDEYPEIVVVAHGTVRLHEHDGTRIWGPVELPGVGNEAGGAPTIANFDADPEPEIGVAGSTQYVVFEPGGSIKWQSTTQDGSSNQTGSTVFDLDGDGKFEVIYRDETHLRIYRGEDGHPLFEYPMSSQTFTELPVVADVDRDGNAEIVVTSDLADFLPVTSHTRGLFVFGDANDNWVAARPVWNQHAYQVDNVGEDGHSIPARPGASWLGHNTFRANVPPSSGPFSAPDLTAARIEVDLSSYPTIRATARVGNAGATFVPEGVPVSFYDGPPTAGARLLGTAGLSQDLDPGRFEELATQFDASGFGSFDLFVVADDDGTENGTQNECDEVNNLHRAAWSTEALGLFVELEDGRRSVQPGTTVSYEVTVTNAGASIRREITLRAELPAANTTFQSASDQGSFLKGTVSWPSFDLPPGGSVLRTLAFEIDGEIPVEIEFLTTSATVSDDGSGGPDPTPGNNTARDTNEVLTVRADAGGPYSGTEGSPIELDGSASSDRDGAIVSYDWDLDGDGEFDDASGPIAEVIYRDDGIFEVALRVEDEDGEIDITNASVTVINSVPVFDAGPDRQIAEGATLMLTVAFSDAGVSDTHVGTVDWGDGVPVSGAIDETVGAGTLSASRSWADDGSFEVQICVSDDGGGESCDQFHLEVLNADPVVVAGERNVDLRTWDSNDYGQNRGNWRVSDDGSRVDQLRNSEPSVFFGDFPAIGVTLQGRIRTGTSSDDDFIGFVLGYEPGDASDPEAEFLLIDWKQGTQNLNGCGVSTTAPRGLAVSRVRGIPNPVELWSHRDLPCSGSVGSVEELARGLTLGSKGWGDWAWHTFLFESSSTHLRIWVDGILEIDLEGDFALTGRFGFYNYSQPSVTYESFSSLGISVTEGGQVSLAVPWLDPGVDDSHTARIDWRDGVVEAVAPVTLAAGAGRIEGVHRYLDDLSDSIEICLTDDDEGMGCGSLPVSVVNASPRVDAGPDLFTTTGVPVQLDLASVTDLGGLDTHSASVDWGDGSIEPVEIIESDSKKGISASHAYEDEGTFPVELCVTDDDGGTGCDSLTVVQLEPILDLGVVKTAERPFVRPGAEARYTIEVENRGTLRAEGIAVRDSLPHGLEFVAAEPEGQIDASERTITWLIDSLGYQESRTFTLVTRSASPVERGFVVRNLVDVTDDGRHGPDARPEDNHTVAPVTLWDTDSPFVEIGAGLPIEGHDFVLPDTRFWTREADAARTAVVDWGDGTVETASISTSGVEGTVSASHRYVEDGAYPLEVCVEQVDGARGCSGRMLRVGNAAPAVNDGRDVDLHSWVDEPEGAGDWVVQSNGSSVVQRVNGGPTIFYGDFPSFGSRIEGVIRAQTYGDDDFIGFALGYQPGEFENPQADYLLLTWKQGTQSWNHGCGSQTAHQGLALLRVTGIPHPGELWSGKDLDCNGHENRVDTLMRGINYGSRYWSAFRDYRFRFEFDANSLRVWVDEVLEIDVTGRFTNGRLGFYNNSQAYIQYRSFQKLERFVDEGTSLELVESFVDDGILDIHEATFDWRDGQVEIGTVEEADGVGSVGATHSYRDDGRFDVAVCVTDDEGDEGCGIFPISVENVVPVVALAGDLVAEVGRSTSIQLGSFTDAGLADVHSASVDWGDGASGEASVLQGEGKGVVVGRHLYTAPGVFPIEVCVVDDDGGRTCETGSIKVEEPRVPPVLTVTDVSLVEGDGPADLTLAFALSDSWRTDVSVGWRTVDGSAAGGEDFEARAGRLTFPAGVTNATIEIPILGDLRDEPDEVFEVVFSDPVELLLPDSRSSVKILDDDEPPVLSVAPVKILEGDEGVAEAEVSLNLSQASGYGVSLAYRTVDGTATADEDFEPSAGSVTIPAGALSGDLTLRVLSDRLDELDEFLTVELSDPNRVTLPNSEVYVTILDDDEAVLSIGDASVEEGDAGTRPIDLALVLSNPSDREIRADWSTLPDSAATGEDFVEDSGTVVIAPLETTAGITVGVMGDLVLEEDEMFLVELATPVNADLVEPSGLVTIFDDELCPGPNLLADAGAEQRPYFAGFAQWEITEGLWERGFSDPPPLEGETYFRSAAEGRSQLTQQVSLTKLSPEIDRGEQRLVLAGWLRAGVPGESAARIELETLDAESAILTRAESEVVEASEWRLVTHGVEPVPGATALRIRLVAEGQGASFDGLELRPLRTPIVTVDDTSVLEGDPATLTEAPFSVRLACLWEHDLTLTYRTVDGTARAGEDYVAMSGSIDLASGSTEVTIPVQVHGDDEDEPAEKFRLQLEPSSTRSGAVLLDALAEGTILPDDWCPRSPGYWKNHSAVWPVDWLLLGEIEYEQAALLDLLGYGGPDSPTKVARALTAMRLNQERGFQSPELKSLFETGDDYLRRHPPGSRPKGAAKAEGEDLKGLLESYYETSQCD